MPFNCQTYLKQCWAPTILRNVNFLCFNHDLNKTTRSVTYSKMSKLFCWWNRCCIPFFNVFYENFLWMPGVPRYSHPLETVFFFGQGHQRCWPNVRPTRRPKEIPTTCRIVEVGWPGVSLQLGKLATEWGGESVGFCWDDFFVIFGWLVS